MPSASTAGNAFTLLRFWRLFHLLCVGAPWPDLWPWIALRPRGVAARIGVVL